MAVCLNFQLFFYIISLKVSIILRAVKGKDLFLSTKCPFTAHENVPSKSQTFGWYMLNSTNFHKATLTYVPGDNRHLLGAQCGWSLSFSVSACGSYTYCQQFGAGGGGGWWWWWCMCEVPTTDTTACVKPTSVRNITKAGDSVFLDHSDCYYIRCSFFYAVQDLTP